MVWDGRPSERAAPWEMLARHTGRPLAFFLDRATDERPSFAGSGPVRRLIVRSDGRAMIETEGRWAVSGGDPVDAIAGFIAADETAARGLPESLAGHQALPRTVGYLSYELGGLIEGIEPAGPALAPAPLAVLATYDHVDGWDPATGRHFQLDFSGGRQRRPCSAEMPAMPASNEGGNDEASDRRSYREGFMRLKAAIADGEIYQANLARRMSFGLEGEPVAIYSRLRRAQAVPQGAYLDIGALKLLSNSPECFLLVEDGNVRTFPIKGTRSRAGDAAGDREQVRRLRTDPKELAEHIMIVDLERNDLGRVCETGSIEVVEAAALRSFTTVHHLVSEVRGRLRSGVGLAEVLRATFPGGSITGAPKISAMKLISEVEPYSRGVYTGAIGCFNGASAYELNIAIRTAVATPRRIHYFAGGGIVADSRLDAEYEETVTKSRAFLDALPDSGASGKAAAN